MDSRRIRVLELMGMNMRNLLSSVVVGATLAISVTAASAATVTLGGMAFAPTPVMTPTSETGTVFRDVTGSISGVRADPWAATAFAGNGLYTSVQADSSATYAASGNSINLLWGTPDSYNFIDFLDADGIQLDTIGGGETGIENFADQTTNRFVTVSSDTAFSFIRYRSVGSNAFEFATVNPVPVPAAGLLLLGALGGIAALRKRRDA